MSRRTPRFKHVETFFLQSEPDKTESVSPTPWHPKLFYWNIGAALLHLVQFLIVLGLNVKYLDKDSATFLTGNVALRFTHHMVVPSDQEPTCSGSGLTVLADYTNRSSPINPDLYDFSNTVVYRYTEPFTVRTEWMIDAFFLLSCTFQLLNTYLLRKNQDQPRLLHFIEYSITGSLCLIVMAINFGIRDLTAISNLFGLFFGMNILGACAELLMYMAEMVTDTDTPNFLGFDLNTLWVIPHLAGWILFAMSLGPVLAQFRRLHHCSERKPPEYFAAVQVLETIAFILFGLVQTWALWARTMLKTKTTTMFTWLLPANRHDVAFWMDGWMIGLSFIAKTALAWILLAPVLIFRTQ